MDEASKALAGVHAVEGQRYAARLKMSFHPSGVILFDYDVVRGMPEDLHYSTSDKWLKALRKMIPAMEDVGCLVAPSSSSRAMLNGKPVSDNCGFHAYVLVEDANDVERFRGELNVYALCTPYGFLRPIYNQESGKAVAKWPWSITDTTVLSCERLVFDGKPKGWLGVDIAPVSIERIDGGCLDTSLTVITDDQLKELKKKTGNQISRKELKSGKRIIKAIYGYNDTALTLATEVDTRSGRMTVKEFWASKERKVRCQAVFRPESTSWAAFLSKNDAGMPYLFDCGGNIFFNLGKAEKDELQAAAKPLKVLNKYLVTEEDVKSIKSQTHKYKKCVPGGQLFILVGVGGSGKTTVMEYICSHISGEVYYFNMDTPSVHIPEAQKRAEEGNYYLLCPDLKGGIDQVVNDLKLINQEGADLSDVTIVLDTIKKIMDMGDKGDIKRLMKVLRSLTTKGATVIGLGHTNKYANDDGWPNYEGTVDLRNDCDAMACLIHYRKPDDPDTIITSLYWQEQGWEHAKDRGEVEPATWVIDRSNNRKVTELDTWVDTKKLNDEAQQLEQAGNILHDLIEYLASQPEGVNQSQVVTAMAAIPHSRRQVLEHLKTYDGKLWSRQTKKELNAQIYTLMPGASEYVRKVSK